MCQGKTEESEYIAWGSTQLSVFIHVQQFIPNFTQKTSRIVMTGAEAFKIGHSSCTLNVPVFVYSK